MIFSRNTSGENHRIPFCAKLFKLCHWKKLEPLELEICPTFNRNCEICIDLRGHDPWRAELQWIYGGRWERHLTSPAISRDISFPALVPRVPGHSGDFDAIISQEDGWELWQSGAQLESGAGPAIYGFYGHEMRWNTMEEEHEAFKN